MPKLKTHSSASKRFKVTGSGKIIRRKAAKSHLLTNKSSSKKRILGKPVLVGPTNEKQIKRLIPYK